MSHDTLNYTRCAVIVHGKSEFALVKYIYTNLHLPVKIIAKDKGRGSIQINGLPEYLMKKQFRTLKAFADEFSVEYDRKTKRLINFKLFIIMDTDDCDEITRSKYISKELFDGHPLKDYIVPLYNDTNLEDVMIKSGIMVKRIPDAQKTSVYKGYKQDKIEMRGDRAEMSDFPLYLNMVAGGLDCRDQAIGGFSFVVKIYAVPVVEIIG